MKALYIHGKQDIRLEEAPLPEPGEGEVRLRMAYAGICGSDLHYYFEGANGAFVVEEPMAPGHEVSGYVDYDPSGKLGANTPVTVHPATFGAVVPGIEDKRHLFPGGSYLGSASTHPHTQGGMMEYLIVKDFMVRELPKGMSLRLAALAEPLAVSLHGINIAGGVEGKKVLVSGSGPIGLLAAAGAIAAGATEVVCTDVLDGPLERAAKLGAKTVRVDKEALPSNYFDVVLECSGIPAAINATFAAIRQAGIHTQVGMMPSTPQPILLASVISKEVQIRGSFRFNNEIDEAIALLAERPEIGDIVVTHTISADEVVDAFAVAKDSQKSGKVLVDLWN